MNDKALSDIEREARRTERWQRKLLPYMITGIGLMALFFFIASLWQVNFLYARLNYQSKDITSVFTEFEQRIEQDKDAALGLLKSLDYLELKTKASFEQEIVARRYHGANSVIITRIWTRYLGFLTGMILSFVGAIFILGKLRESETKLEGETEGWKVSLLTSSPGIILAVLGTVIMVFSLAIRADVSATDKPVYFGTPSDTSGDEIDTGSLFGLPRPKKTESTKSTSVGETKKGTQVQGQEPKNK